MVMSNALSLRVKFPDKVTPVGRRSDRCRCIAHAPVSVVRMRVSRRGNPWSMWAKAVHSRRVQRIEMLAKHLPQTAATSAS